MLTLYPEQPPHSDLVIGLVAPMGTSTTVVRDVFKRQLISLGYRFKTLKLSALLECRRGQLIAASRSRTREWYCAAQRAGNEFCEEHSRADALGRLAIRRMSAIRDEREKVREPGATREPYAFLISSFKRPAEVELFRAVYGKAFVLVGIDDTFEARVEQLAEKLADAENRKRTREDLARATALIATDYDEPHASGGKSSRYGQNVLRTYPMADAFIGARVPAQAAKHTRRIIDTMFTPSFKTPTKDEHAMVHAYMAGARSADLARQVGAAVVSPYGEVLSTGTNDVPRPGGGIYWEGDADDARDFALGRNISKERRIRLAREVVSILQANMKSEVPQPAAGDNKVDASVPHGNTKSEVPQPVLDDNQLDALLEDSQLLAIGEFGRTVHAEMDALTTACRLGVPVRGASVYTSTFPCHNCVRHLIAAGITSVVYMMPFDKSLAFELHSDAIASEGRDFNPDKVRMLQFVGIAPRRYLDFFEAGKDDRKDENDQPASAEEDRELKAQFGTDEAQFREIERRIAAQFPPIEEKEQLALNASETVH